MPPTLPPLVTDAAALSVAGVGLSQYKMGPALIGAGADATVVHHGRLGSGITPGPG
ncbi:hypothetical protein [Streptomyces sp. NPDC001296]